MGSADAVAVKTYLPTDIHAAKAWHVAELNSRRVGAGLATSSAACSAEMVRLVLSASTSASGEPTHRRRSTLILSKGPKSPRLTCSRCGVAALFRPLSLLQTAAAIQALLVQNFKCAKSRRDHRLPTSRDQNLRAEFVENFPARDSSELG